MKKIISLISTLMFCAVSQATLLSVNLNEASGEYTVGQQITANIVISDIDLSTGGFQQILGAFAMDVIYDDALLSVNSVNYGSYLENGFFADKFELPSVAGAQNIGFNSDPFELGALFNLQNGLSSFSLATITFDASVIGKGLIDLSNVSLFDDLGFAFSGDIDTSAAAYSVTASGNPVPTPATLLLMIIGGIALATRKKA